MNRRTFFAQALGLGILARSVARADSRPASPANLRLGSSGAKRLIEPADMHYRGMWRASYLGSGTGDDTTFSTGTCCFYRANGELRLWYFGRGGKRATAVEGAWDGGPGQILEFQLPTTFGTTVESAPELTCVKKYGGGEPWASGYYYTVNGCSIGGIWYDSEWDVLWYTMYSTYAGLLDPPWLGATRFHPDGRYEKFGPWKFPLGNQQQGEDPQAYRLCNWWIWEAPPSVKAQNSRAEMCVGACVGSTAASGNVGPGLYWFKRPALTPYQEGVTHTMNGVIGTALLRIPNDSTHWGPLQNYNTTFDADPHGGVCRRSWDYHHFPGSEGDRLSQPPKDGIGFWQASVDNIGLHQWVEGTAKWGIISMGRMMAPGRYLAYTHDNPHREPDGQEYYSNVIGGGNGYKPFVRYPDQYNSTNNTPSLDPALLVFSPAHALEVMKRDGTRKAWDVQFQAQYNWRTLWNLPLLADSVVGVYPNGGAYEVYYCPQGNPSQGCYDRTTQRLIWAMPATHRSVYSYNPTFQVFDLALG